MLVHCSNFSTHAAEPSAMLVRCAGTLLFEHLVCVLVPRGTRMNWMTFLSINTRICEHNVVMIYTIIEVICVKIKEVL